MKDKTPDDAVKNTSCDDGAAVDGAGLETTVDSLYLVISEIVEDARKTVYRATNQAMVRAYWEIGRVIVEEEQHGERRAEYGRALIVGISTRLTQKYGRGFSRRNLADMRRFFLEFENLQTVSAKSLIPQTQSAELSWSHYCLLMRVKDKNARDFYVIESAKNNWSVRELDRQISSLLFERLALSRDQESRSSPQNTGSACRPKRSSSGRSPRSGRGWSLLSGRVAEIDRLGSAISECRPSSISYTFRPAGML